MDKKLQIVLACTLLVLVFFVGKSWAKAICQSHPLSQWLKTDELTKILKEQGYIINWCEGLILQRENQSLTNGVWHVT